MNKIKAIKLSERFIPDSIKKVRIFWCKAWLYGPSYRHFIWCIWYGPNKYRERAEPYLPFKIFQGTFQPDLLASIVYLYPELVLEKDSFCCTVELDGKYTRSMMVVDRLKRIEFENHLKSAFGMEHWKRAVM